MIIVLGYLIIGMLWQVLEVLSYGEIQPRAVDDIIAIAWCALAGLSYFIGYKRGYAECEDASNEEE